MFYDMGLLGYFKGRSVAAYVSVSVLSVPCFLFFLILGPLMKFLLFALHRCRDLTLLEVSFVGESFKNVELVSFVLFFLFLVFYLLD